MISPDDMKILKGKGMPFFKDSMTHGNLFIKLKVVFPKRGELTSNQTFLLKQVNFNYLIFLHLIIYFYLKKNVLSYLIIKKIKIKKRFYPIIIRYNLKREKMLNI